MEERGDSRPRRLGLVLSGGGARGVFQVGVYARLREDPRFARGFSVLSGTSAGAINAALIASGKTPDELLQFWYGLAEDPPVTASEAFLRDAWRTASRLLAREPRRLLAAPGALRVIASAARRHLAPPRRGGVSAWLLEVVLLARFELVQRFLESVGESFLFDTGRLRARLVAALGGERVAPDPGVAVAVNAMDARTGQVVRYASTAPRYSKLAEYEVVDAITVDMIVASASIPLLFPAVKVGSRLLWDGGVLVNTPLAPVVDLDGEEIVTVLVTEPADASLPAFPNLGDAIERMADSFLENTYNVDRMLLLDRNLLAKQHAAAYREVTLYEPIRPLPSTAFTAASYLDFGHATVTSLYQAGRLAAAEWLRRGPRVDEADARRAAPAGVGEAAPMHA